MIRSSFIAMLLTCVVCSFCGQDFITLGRHSWRCKQRINPAEQDHPHSSTRDMPVMQSPNVPVSCRTVVKCCCGKICKGARGLKMHQRSCQVIHGLNYELCKDLEEQITEDNHGRTGQYFLGGRSVICPTVKKIARLLFGLFTDSRMT